MIFSQVVLLPLLLVFTWGYLALRPASTCRIALAVYDTLVIILALVSGVGAGWLTHAWYTGADNLIWRVVTSTVTTFHVFPAVLLAGWYIRKRVFAVPGS